MPDYIPSSDTIYQDWLANFLTVANSNLGAIGLTTADMTPLTTDKTNFDLAITDAETKQAAAKAATEKKSILRKASELKARALVKRIQAKVDVTADLKRQLQITVPGESGGLPVVPYTPMDLIANVVGIGSYELTWKRNGNAQSIIFVVEAKINSGTEFIQIDSSNRTYFTHLGNPAGAKIVYRVRAKHGDVFSAPSNEFTVNG